MNEFLHENPPPAETQQKDPRQELIDTKIERTWGSCVGEKGYGDTTEVAHRLYDALYDPENAVSNMEQRRLASDPGVGVHPPLPLRDSVRTAVEAPLDFEGEVPDREEFVNTISETMIRDVDVSKVLLDGAREQIVELGERGVQVVFWSAGEPRHQHHKLGGIGFVDPENVGSVEPPVEVSSGYGDPVEVMTAIATDKTTEENMTKVEQITGDRQLVVVDDRTKNLLKFIERFPDAKAIWVQFGAHAEKAVAKLAAGEESQLAEAIEQGRIVHIESVSQVAAMINQFYGQGQLDQMRELVAAFDFDDTIIDNEKRRDMQHIAVREKLQEQAWV